MIASTHAGAAGRISFLEVVSILGSSGTNPKSSILESEVDGVVYQPYLGNLLSEPNIQPKA